MTISVFDRVENIVGEEKNADYEQFLFFSHCFQEVSYTGLLKVVIVWLGVKCFYLIYLADDVINRELSGQLSESCCDCHPTNSFQDNRESCLWL